MFKTILTIAAAALTATVVILAVVVSATYLYRRIKFNQLNKRNKDMLMRLAGLNNKNKKSATIHSDTIMHKKFEEDIKRWPKLKREPFPESPEALKAWREDNAWCNPDKPFNDALKASNTKDAQLVLEMIKKAKADKSKG